MSKQTPPTSPDASRTAVQEYLRRRQKYTGTGFRGHLRHWARDTFSREQLIMSLRSLVLVAPLTVIIWIYAEREQLVPVKNQTIPIVVKSQNPKLVVTIVDPADKNITAEMYGPRAGIDRVSELLRKLPQTNGGVEIEVPASDVPGHTYTVPASVISDAEIFRKNGVIIQEANPLNLRIEIDSIVDRDIEVQPQADLQNLASPPTFEPRKVRISGPQAVLDAADANGQLNVFADLKSFRELKTPGKHELKNVPLLILPTGRDITVVPTTVNATVEIRQADVQHEFPALPIYVTYSQTMDDKFKAICPASLPNVTVFGPRDQIEAMLRPDFQPQPKVRIEVSQKDSTHVSEKLTAKPIFDLPPGVHVSDADEQKTIEYHIENRTAPE